MCIHLRAELLRYGRMGMPADVYAFGITMWELYTGQVRGRPLLRYPLYFICNNQHYVAVAWRQQQQQHLMLL
jgi:hypothetical protein